MKNKRVRSHIRYMTRRVYDLKYNILNDALELKVNSNKIFLFKKYNRRLKLLKL